MLPIMAGSGGGELTPRAYLGAFRPAGESGRTQAKRRQIYAAFLEHLGAAADQALSALGGEACRSFFEERAQSMAPTTLRAYRAYLNKAFNAAVERGLLRVSPMQGVPQPSRLPVCAGEGAEAEKNFTEQEVARMLKEFPPAYRALVALRVHAGLGITECQNLRRSQLNTAAGLLLIKNHDYRGGFIAHALPPFLVGLLEDMAHPEDEFLLQELHGIHTCHVSRKFTALCRQYGLIPPNPTRRMPGGGRRNERSFLSLRVAE